MKFRLILDPPRSARLNMAIDEMLMMRQRREETLPALRFYSWDGPAVTCGYFQSVRTVARRHAGVEVVRRLTGGGMVLHGKDLTFSLTARDNHPFFAGNVKDSYLKISEAVRTGLKDAFPGLDYAECREGASPRGRGERVCFEQPVCFDLMWQGQKAVGSSQRHSDQAVLYQSSLFFPAKPQALMDGIQNGFAALWKSVFVPEPLADAELAAAEAILCERYASEDWRFLEASFFSKHSGQL